MVQPDARGKHAYRFQKIFTDGQYMAGGVLEIPVGASKPLKPARDNTYVRFIRVGPNPRVNDTDFGGACIDVLRSPRRHSCYDLPNPGYGRRRWFPHGTPRCVSLTRGRHEVLF
jgi:hypothetical protein